MIKLSNIRSLKLTHLDGLWFKTWLGLHKLEESANPLSCTGLSLGKLLTLFNIGSVNEIRSQHLTKNIDGTHYIRNAMHKLN